MIVTIAGSAVTFLPDDAELAGISIEVAAFDGSIGTGQFPMPDPSSAISPVTGRQFEVVQDFALISDGFMVDFDTHRGPFRVGAQVEYPISVQDANALLDGFIVTRARPAETDYARVIAFAGLDLPTVDTTWVLNTSTTTLPAKGYDGIGWADLIADCVAFTGKTLFLHDKATGGRCLHYHLLTTGHSCGLSISDVVTAQNGVTVFAPMDPTRQRTSVDLVNSVKGRSQSGLTSFQFDATSITAHNADGLFHQGIVDFDAVSQADLNTQTTAYLASSKNDYDVYTCTIGPLDGTALGRMRVGDIMTVTSAAMGLSASAQRIAHITYTVADSIASGLWFATLELGAPTRRRARVKPGPGVARIVVPYIDVPYVPITDTVVASAVIYTPEGNDHFGYPPLVVFGSTGDAPSGGLPYDPLTGALEYVAETNGFGTRQTGLRATGPGTVTIHAKESFIGVFGDSTVTIRMEIVRNGITIAFDEDSGTFGFPSLFAGTLEATSAPITMATGDFFQVNTTTSSGGAVTIPWGTGVGGEELRVTGTSSSGSVLNPPAPGRLVREQIVDTGGSTTDYLANFPFLPKTLRVTVAGVQVVPTEVDGSAGTFTLPFAVDPALVPVIITYRGAGGDQTAAQNDPNPPSVYTLVEADLLGTGSDGSGDHVLLDDGTWGAVPPPAVTEGLVPYYIPVGDTYTVPVYKQALFSDPIEVDGALVVNGVLIGVD